MKCRTWDEIESKDIWLFGTGECAEKFYHTYKNVLNIAGCYDNRNQGTFHGLPVKRPVSGQQVGEKEYIIICTVRYHNEIENQLVFMGYRPLYDYASIKSVELLLEIKQGEGRKMAFFYGTCHINAIMNAMKIVPEFYRQYYGICIRVNEQDKVMVLLADYLLKRCDLLIYEKYLGNPVDRNKDIVGSRIGIPQLMFWGYWPQSTNKAEFNEFWREDFSNQGTAIESLFQDSLIQKADIFLNRLIWEDRSDDEIMEAALSDEAFSKDKVISSLDRNLKYIKMTERYADIKISDWIIEKYKSKRVYKDYIHLDEPIIWEYVARICHYMDIEEWNIDEHNEEVYPYTEMPVYPCVVKFLGLEMIDGSTEYTVTAGGQTTCKFSFEEYQKEYIRRAKIVKKLILQQKSNKINNDKVQTFLKLKGRTV